MPPQGSSVKKHKRNTFAFKSIRSDAPWKHLFLLGRTTTPRQWGSVADIEGHIQLGYVSRDAYDHALGSRDRSHSLPVAFIIDFIVIIVPLSVQSCLSTGNPRS